MTSFNDDIKERTLGVKWDVSNGFVSLCRGMVWYHCQEWFDGEIADEIKNQDKLFKKFKKSKLHLDKDIYNSARYKLQKNDF